MTEDRSQMTDDRGQTTDDRGQRTDDRRQRLKPEGGPAVVRKDWTMARLACGRWKYISIEHSAERIEQRAD